MTEWEREFITRHRLAHLATIDENGKPHVVPIVYAFDSNKLFTPIDDKPKSVNPKQLQRVRNIKLNEYVSVIIDDYSEDWTKLAWVQIRGQAEILSYGDEYEIGIKLLTKKYPQYRDMPIQGKLLITISPQKVLSWRSF